MMMATDLIDGRRNPQTLNLWPYPHVCNNDRAYVRRRFERAQDLKN
jgi:hypothetical protein